ncbi:hypothetical protein QQ045_023846 [Rhodiola kirilowii]
MERLKLILLVLFLICMVASTEGEVYEPTRLGRGGGPRFGLGGLGRGLGRPRMTFGRHGKGFGRGGFGGPGFGGGFPGLGGPGKRNGVENQKATTPITATKGEVAAFAGSP